MDACLQNYRTSFLAFFFSAANKKLVYILFAFTISLPLFPQVNFGSAAAFSLRKIVPAYTGNAIQVRRSSDNTTQNIGFTSCGFLDTAAMKTFVGSGSGFVSIWYDQSGNGRDASQSTAANQPRIINTGTVDYANKRPAMVWPGTNSNGIYLAYSTNTTLRTVNAVRDFKLNPFTSSANNMQYLFSCPANSDFSIRLSSTGNFTYDGDNNSNDWINGSGAPKLCWVNGTQTTTAQFALHSITAASSTTINGSFSIGSTFSSRDLFSNDAVSELVAYSNTITNTQRTLIETGEAAIYSLTISNNKYTPPSSTSYIYYINGVGRESASDSISATRSSKGMGFIIGKTSADFLKDNGDYLTAGMDCPVTGTTSTSNLPATIVQRWANDWYINKTDVSANSGTVTIYFDFSEYGIGNAPASSPVAVGNYELLSRSSSTGTFAIVAGTTKSVTGTRVFFTLDASAIPTNNYYTIGTKSVAASPLPVELMYYNCQSESSGRVMLNWATATELNNDHFLIERSADGINYQTVGKIKGAGTTSRANTYSLEDAAPLELVSYYRLMQVNKEGTSKAYPVCAVNRQNAYGVIISPNPADAHIEINAPAGDLQTLIITDAAGKQILQQQFTERLGVSTADFENGFYIVSITGQGSAVTRKLIVHH